MIFYDPLNDIPNSMRVEMHPCRNTFGIDQCKLHEYVSIRHEQVIFVMKNLFEVGRWRFLISLSVKVSVHGR